MILSFFLFILTIFVSYVVWPSFSGDPLFIPIIVFLSAIIVFNDNFKKGFFEVLLFGLILDLISGDFLSFSIPLTLSFLLFEWLDSFIELTPRSKSHRSFYSLTYLPPILLMVVAVFYVLFYLIDSGFNLSYFKYQLFLNINILNLIVLLAWSIVWSYIFKYLRKIKNNVLA